MDTINNNDLIELLTQKNSRSVSIYLTMFRAGYDLQQNPLKFKNALLQAEDLLVKVGMRRTEAEDLLDRARKFMPQTHFWQNQSDGIALFLNKTYFRYFRLPEKFSELVEVSDHFHTKPLVKLLSTNVNYFALDLDLKKPRLYKADRFSFTPYPDSVMPPSLDEALFFDTQEKNTQFSSKPRNISGPQPTVFGYGRQTDKRKVNIINYFHIVNTSVMKVLHGNNDPLVLCGIDELHPLYKNSNTYGNLVENGYRQGTEHLSDSELHQLTWNIISSMSMQERLHAIEKFQMLYGEKSQKVVNTIEKVVLESKIGAIETLFVMDTNVRVWGKVDEEQQSVEVHDQEYSGDTDLLDYATAQTLLNRGKVYIVTPQETPDGNTAAAIMRFSV